MITLDPQADIPRVSMALNVALLEEHIGFSKEFRDDLVRRMFLVLQQGVVQ